MYICDCHCDTLTRIYHKDQSLYQNDGHFDVRRLLQNGGGLQFMAIYIDEQYQYQGGARYTLQIMDKLQRELRALTEQGTEMVFVKTAEDVISLEAQKNAILLAIEDGAAIEGSLEVLRMFYQLGVRSMTLTWNHRNAIADGAHEFISGGGLTQFGRQVVAEMNTLGMLIDVSHIAPRGFWDVMETSIKPVIASHSNAFRLCGVPRNLDDEQIKAIAAKGGVIGINFYPDFLHEQPEQATLDDIYRHIEYMLEVAGSNHVAFGADLDGVSRLPQGVTGVESYLALLDYLTKKGYAKETIEDIAHNNVLALLKKVLQ